MKEEQERAFQEAQIRDQEREVMIKEQEEEQKMQEQLAEAKRRSEIEAKCVVKYLSEYSTKIFLKLQ